MSASCEFDKCFKEKIHLKCNSKDDGLFFGTVLSDFEWTFELAIIFFLE